jgi:flagellar basal body-associated protein FliL
MSTTGQSILIITLIVLNFIAAAAYYVFWVIIKLNKDKSLLIRTIVIALCPVVGIVFIGLSYLWYKVFMSAPVNLEDVIFGKEHPKFETKAEEDKEKNMIPLEEAIAITEKQDLRTLMMNVVSSDIKNSLSSITLALNSEDTETAHYAASVLQDALNDFRTMVDKEYKDILEDAPDKYERCSHLIDYMDQVLSQKVFIEMEQRSYVGIMEAVGEILYMGEPDGITSVQFEAISLRLLGIEDFEKCEKWCERARIHCPSALSSYTCQLKLFFSMNRRDDFFRVIDELKASPIVIDRETLELIRVFT